MDKESFKIGDKVKLKGSHYCGINSNDTGVVVGVHCYIKVLWSGDLRRRLGGSYPHKTTEIEHIAKIGEQLLFKFMLED